jgi:hypothetical protein
MTVLDGPTSSTAQGVHDREDNESTEQSDTDVAIHGGDVQGGLLSRWGTRRGSVSMGELAGMVASHGLPPSRADRRGMEIAKIATIKRLVAGARCR